MYVITYYNYIVVAYNCKMQYIRDFIHDIIPPLEPGRDSYNNGIFPNDSRITDTTAQTNGKLIDNSMRQGEITITKYL